MPIELLLKELKNLFGIVDSNFKALMASTINTRQAPKNWSFVLVKQYRVFRDIYNDRIFYTNTRKTDIVLRSLHYYSETAAVFQLYTDKQEILTTDHDGGYGLTYAAFNISDINLIIHPNEIIHFRGDSVSQNQDVELIAHFSEV